MFKTIVFLAFILIAVFSQDDSHPPHKKYHFIGGYNSTYSCNDCVYTDPIWQEILRRNPTWSEYITPVPFLTIDEFYEVSVQCYQDASVVTYPWYPEYGNMPHFPPYFSKLAFIGFCNMPRAPVDQNTSHPCPGLAPTCASLDYCTTQDYASAAQLSNTNNAPIFIHYDPTKLFTQIVNDIRDRFVAAGAKNVTVVVDSYDGETYFNLMLRVANIDPAHEIHFLPNPYFDDLYCQTIKSQGLQPNLPFLSEFNYPIYSPGFGFPTCLNNTKFVHDLQQTMDDMIKEGTLCTIFSQNPQWCLLPYYVNNNLIADQYKQCLKVWKICQF